jgi:hypothetical protein
VEQLFPSVISVLIRFRDMTAAIALGAFLGLGLRALILLVLDRLAGGLTTLIRILAAIFYLGAFWLLSIFSRPWLVWTSTSIFGAVIALGLVLGSLGFVRSRDAPHGAWGAGVVHLLLLLLLVPASLVTLVAASFLSLVEDQPVLLVDVTGETGTQNVHWGPPDSPPREEVLVTHRVVFRAPDGSPVAEAWLYGDEVAVKGRVLRLSPWLNASGLPNLFELLFAHNGYKTAERHNTYPHEAIPLPPEGPLTVHTWWRPVQARILESWEHGFPEGSGWAVRSVTTESTFFPLVDASGLPTKGLYRLVLTPGGLTAG